MRAGKIEAVGEVERRVIAEDDGTFSFAISMAPPKPPKKQLPANKGS